MNMKWSVSAEARSAIGKIGLLLQSLIRWGEPLGSPQPHPHIAVVITLSFSHSPISMQSQFPPRPHRGLDIVNGLWLRSGPFPAHPLD